MEPYDVLIGFQAPTFTVSLIASSYWTKNPRTVVPGTARCAGTSLVAIACVSR